MKKTVSLFIIIAMLSALTEIPPVFADDIDASPTVEENFDTGTDTYKQILGFSNMESVGVSEDGFLTVGCNKNVISTIDSYSDYIIQFDYNPYYYALESNPKPRLAFTVGGYSFHMIGLANGVSTPQGVSSGASVSRVNTFSFPQREWSTIRVKKLAKKIELYAKHPDDDSFTLVYKGTFAKNNKTPFMLNIYDTSDVTAEHPTDWQGWLDNLKIWDLSFAAAIENKLYDINPGSVNISFNDLISDTVPETVTVSNGNRNIDCVLQRNDDTTVTVAIPDGELGYNTEYAIDLTGITSANGVNAGSIKFKTIVHMIAEIRNEQTTRKDSEIEISLYPEGLAEGEYTVNAESPETITVYDPDDSGTAFEARTSENKIYIKIPQQLSYNAKYTVDLSQVKAVYTIGGRDYDCYFENIYFYTDNGEKETAIDAVNNAAEKKDMIDALTALNELSDVSSRIDVFGDAYFTNVSSDNAKLNKRKEALAEKLIEYRNENGSFVKMDFSDIIEAVNECLYELSSGDDDIDGELVVNEPFDADTNTYKKVIALSKGDFTGIAAGGYLTVGYNQNIISTVDGYTDYIIQFDYNPYYYDLQNNAYPRFVFDIGGYGFHMIGLANGVETPQGVSSGANITRVNDFSFPHREWSTIRIQKFADTFELYAKKRDDRSFILVYRGTFDNIIKSPFEFNVYDTSEVTAEHMSDWQGWMDNLKIWDISLSAHIEDRLYDTDPGFIDVTFDKALAESVPLIVKLSDGKSSISCTLAKKDDKTVRINIPDGKLNYNTEYTVELSDISSSSGSHADTVTFRTIVKTVAEIKNEQPTRKDSEIEIDISPEGRVKDEYTLNALIPDTITVSDTGGNELNFAARTSENKIYIKIPQQLSYNAKYTVDLSQVKAVYTTGGRDYECPLEDVTFYTNDGEKETVLDDINNAAKESRMISALEALNELNDELARVNLFGDKYFTSALSDAAKLAERKNRFAGKIMAYRDQNGFFTKMDFSDLTEAADKCLFELKVESYADPNEAAEDLLSVFKDTGVYRSGKEKAAAGALITELIGGGSCKTKEEFTGFEKKARSAVAVSLAENDDIITVFDDTENYDFEGIVDLTNEDYTANKLAVAAKMTAMRGSTFTFYTVKGLEDDFALATAITAVNAAETRTGAAAAVSKYEKVLGLDLTEYNKLDPNLVCTALASRTFNNAAEIQQAIDRRVAELKSGSSGAGTSSQSRASGGGAEAAEVWCLLPRQRYRLHSLPFSRMTPNLTLKRPIRSRLEIWNL